MESLHNCVEARRNIAETPYINSASLNAIFHNIYVFLWRGLYLIQVDMEKDAEIFMLQCLGMESVDAKHSRFAIGTKSQSENSIIAGATQTIH